MRMLPREHQHCIRERERAKNKNAAVETFDGRFERFFAVCHRTFGPRGRFVETFFQASGCTPAAISKVGQLLSEHCRKRRLCASNPGG